MGELRRRAKLPSKGKKLQRSNFRWFLALFGLLSKEGVQTSS